MAPSTRATLALALRSVASNAVADTSSCSAPAAVRLYARHVKLAIAHGAGLPLCAGTKAEPSHEALMRASLPPVK